MSVSDRAGKVVGRSLRWIGLAAVSVGGWALFAALGLTAPSLFAALVVAVVLALTGLGPAAVPRPLSMAAQGTLAVTIGLMLDTETLGALGENWIPAVLVGAGTLVVSAGCGALLALHRDVDPVTGALSLIAGGATGLVSIARELGGDERIVAVVQYLRVALVVVTMPLIVTFAFHADSGSGAAREDISTPWYLGTAFLLGAVVTGIVLARLIRLPAPATLGPLIVAGACELLGWPVDISVPTVLLPVAFIVIGWQAGLAFTTASLRAIGRIFPWAALLVLSIGLVCALFGWALSAVTGVSMLTGYLATTPGGLAAV
ncbi:MAG: AbrB family transcriptional regulator, partial [Rhodococcus sp. (in: high G+C Gram-positive bacteria)]